MQTLDPYWSVKLDQYKRCSGFVGDACITTTPILRYEEHPGSIVIHTKSKHQYRLGRKVRDVEEGLQLREGPKVDVQAGG